MTRQPFVSDEEVTISYIGFPKIFPLNRIIQYQGRAKLMVNSNGIYMTSHSTRPLP